MKCKKIKDLILTSYIDGEASRREIAMVEQHTASCSECGKLLAEMKALSPGSVREKLMEPDGVVWEKIRSRIQSRPAGFLERARSFLMPATRPVPVIASALVILVAGVALFRAFSGGGTAEKLVTEQIYFFDSLSGEETVFNGGLDLPGEELFL